MNILDLVIFFTFLAGILTTGILASRKKLTSDEYHLAGRSLRWVPLGISVVATSLSAVNFTQFSGEISSHGLYVAMALPMLILSAVPVLLIFIPFFNRLKPVSAYEFLENRYNWQVRRLASALFIIWRIFWMALILYASALFLSHVSGINLHVLIIIIGAISTAYTFTGGMRAVVATDILQFIVLFGSITAGLIISAQSFGGFRGLFNIAASEGLLKPFHPFDPGIFSLNPTVRISFWSCLTGAFTAFLARYGADQMMLQRYFSARSLSDARRGFALSIFFSLASLICLGILGFAVHANAIRNGLTGAPQMKHLTSFVLSLPKGMAGLLIAGLCASSMSSIDSGIHSCATAFITDFIKKGNIRASGTSFVFLAPERMFVLFIGLLAVVLSFFMEGLGTIFEIANKIINGLGSPLLALVVLGMYGRGTNACGVFTGGLLGILFSILTGFFLKNLSLHYYAVLNFAGTVMFCYLFSLLFCRVKKEACRGI